MKEERLIIKNFGPIKHIDIPVRKINVLIGNQGTGKSTVAKLLAIFKDASFIVYPDLYNSFNLFYLNNFSQENTEIDFISENFTVKYTFKKGFETKYSTELLGFVELYKREMLSENSDPNSKQLLLQNTVEKIQSLTGQSWYVPAERVKIMTNPNDALDGTANSYLKRFSNNYYSVRNHFNSFDIPFLELKYTFKNNKEILSKNEKELSLSESATGFQNILPIILFTQQFAPTGFAKGYFIIEEPELSLFPTTQKDLINYIVERIYPLDDILFLTTHSPYILTSLNNLLYAYKIGQTNSEETNKIIDKKYWVNSKEVSAYLLNEKGEAEDLMDYEINQIRAERIDEISRKINEEFDALLNIEYNIDK